MAVDAEALLRELRDQVTTLKHDKYFAEYPRYGARYAEIEALKQRADMIIRRVIGDASDYRSRVAALTFTPPSSADNDDVLRIWWHRGFDGFIALIDTMVEELTLFGVEPAPPPTEGEPRLDEPGNRTVFLVHGRNDQVKTEVARFLEKLDLKVIILHEQAAGGQTVIELFEEHAATASYAVVLLTDDDEGGLKGEPARARARQNVVLEMGYFLGRLGRERVAALVSKDVEIPSDYLGVRFIEREGSTWQLELVREMRRAGLDVDMNLAL